MTTETTTAARAARLSNDELVEYIRERGNAVAREIGMPRWYTVDAMVVRGDHVWIATPYSCESYPVEPTRDDVDALFRDWVRDGWAPPRMRAYYIPTAGGERLGVVDADGPTRAFQAWNGLRRGVVYGKGGVAVVADVDDRGLEEPVIIERAEKKGRVVEFYRSGVRVPPGPLYTDEENAAVVLLGLKAKWRGGSDD